MWIRHLINTQQVQGQTLNQSVVIDNITTEGSIQALEGLYPLREIEFERILNGTNKYKQWSIQLCFACLGYFLSIAPQIYDDYKQITDGQLAMLVFVVTACVVLYVIGMLTKDKKKEVIKKINDFFSEEVSQ